MLDKKSEIFIPPQSVQDARQLCPRSPLSLLRPCVCVSASPERYGTGSPRPSLSLCRVVGRSLSPDCSTHCPRHCPGPSVPGTAWASLHSLSTSCGCHLVGSRKKSLQGLSSFCYSKGQSWDRAGLQPGCCLTVSNTRVERSLFGKDGQRFNLSASAVI